MGTDRATHWLRLSTMITAALLLEGCYYLQAAGGQFEVWRAQQPLAEVIDDPATEPALARRLELLREAREFATSELGLPDNGSYRQYADLQREFVLWNVFAAPALSLTPKTWCYWFVGCLAYRGYFEREKAEAYAARLAAEGFDVHVGGVAAYSTLGRFDDPILNTMLARSDAELIALLFHELAHQRLYVRDATAFNESFATAVAEFGMRRWFLQRGEQIDDERYFARLERAAARTELVREARVQLAEIYLGAGTDADKLAAKSQVFERLREQLADSPAARARWQAAELNNAWLATVSVYRGYLPAFRQLFADCEEDFACFYAAVDDLAALPPAARSDHLALLMREGQSVGSDQG